MSTHKNSMNVKLAHLNDAHIAILALNPSVDMTYEIPELLQDQKVHAISTRFDPGGNGINVAQALKRLNTLAHTYCVVAGEIGQLLQRLLVSQLDVVQIEKVDGETRINGTALERGPGLQYEISGIGPPVPETQLHALLDIFTERSKLGFGVLTGSLQRGLSDHLYAQLVEQIQTGGGRAVVDAHDEMLQYAIEAKPFLIKPNRHELESLVGRKLPTVEAVAQQARALQDKGVEYVCVSLGAEGALLTGPDNSHFALAPRVPINSTVGCGDSLVAGMLAALAGKATPGEALRQGVACGAGTVQQPGTELFSASQIAELIPKTKIQQLDI